MNILVDTNIIIPMEPSALKDFCANTDVALEFHNLVQASKNVLFIHPAIEFDFNRDKNKDRAKIRNKIANRYSRIDKPPPISNLDPEIVGIPKIGSNDYVDNCFLASVMGDAVDYLVTEDKGIHKKAKKSGLQERVLYLKDAISILKDFFDKTPPPPPSVKSVKMYELNQYDPIFDSLRSDYPDFDPWFEKGKSEHRRAYAIYEYEREGSQLAGICILKKEKSLPTTKQKSKTLKLCTFKVSENQHGNRYGELLLKTVFDYADKNRYEFIYFTSFPKNDDLLDFAASFGFEIIEVDGEKELIAQKSLAFSKNDMSKYAALDFHIKFGPRVTHFNNNSTFIIPIRMEFHDVLFPELRAQYPMFPDFLPEKPCGNSIKKAYLSNSSTDLIERGDNILFYRSKENQAVTALGIIEDYMRSSDPNIIARYVGSRTVYRYSDIVDLCKKSEGTTLAIKFRYVKPFEDQLKLKELINNGVLKGAPRSITQLSPKGIKWIRRGLKI